MNKRYVQVALPVPLRRQYDYIVGDPFKHIKLLPGMRVSAPFGRRKEQVGIVLSVSDHTSVRPDRLKSLSNIIDDEPLFSLRHFELLCWAPTITTIQSVKRYSALCLCGYGREKDCPIRTAIYQHLPRRA